MMEPKSCDVMFLANILAGTTTPMHLSVTVWEVVANLAYGNITPDDYVIIQHCEDAGSKQKNKII